jgi:hypothetical protein
MRSKLAPAQPGDLREVHHQLLAISHLLENQCPDETFRFDPKQLAWGLGRVLEGLAFEVDDIVRSWEWWTLRKK